MGPREHAREHQVYFVFRRIRRITPGVVFHATRALARDPVRIRAPQTRVLDGLVRIHRDVALRRFLDHAQVMARLHLAVMPFEMDAAIVAQRLHAAGVGHVTGLHRVDAELRVQIERGAQLLFVHGDVAGGFVMTHQAHALLLRIGRERHDVEVRIRLGEAELVAPREPVAVPALVPALDQHAAETIVRREVDVALRLGRGRAVFRPGAPGLRTQVHAPPDADVLERLHPGHVAELVRLVEVEDQVRHVQARRGVGDLQRAPRGRERRLAAHRGPLDDGDSTAFSRCPDTRRSHMPA